MMPRYPLQPPRSATTIGRVGLSGIFPDVDALEGTEAFNVWPTAPQRSATPTPAF